ncbi:MAG: DUF4397 domain-containing protein [Gemmatimonadaceae bacterium]
MLRISGRTTLFLAAAIAVAGCSPDDALTVVPFTPTAGVRFINAVPDSSGAYGLDFRFVDIVENSAAFRIGFRNTPTTTSGITASATVQYRPAAAGVRHFSIFLDDSIQSITSTKLKDSTLTLVDGKNYTAILWGEARAGQMKLKVLEETIADPGSQVALRVINAGTTAIDVRTYPTGGTLPATPTWASVPPLSVSTFVNADTGSIQYNVQPAGGGTALFADQTALLGVVAFSTAGAAGKIDIDAVPGTRVSGSAVTLVVYPRSTVGARTPQTAAFLVPGGSFIWDRRPTRTY